MAASRIPRTSRLDTLRYVAGYMLPNYTQGLFTRNRFWVGFWSRFQPDPAGIRFFGRLRRIHNSGYLYLPTLRSGFLLVLDPEGIRQVLDRSPYIYADPSAKRRGMSHFQPNAVTISRGEDWQERRRFNEAVLDSTAPLHRYADHFLATVRDEVDRSRLLGGGRVTWQNFEPLFETIALRVIFGDSARDDAALMTDLKRMMRTSNRVFLLRKSRHFDRFYGRIRQYLDNPSPDSLIARCGQESSTEKTRVENQIPHWMFAMNETLATNTVRALALIAAHPEAEARVREEISAIDLTQARQVAGLKYLEACFQEAMRLWPTTPVLAREAIREDVLNGQKIRPGTRVHIPNHFNHRDRRTHTFADSFQPQAWIDQDHSKCFHHMSNGLQVCAGKELATFLAQAVLATLLSRHRYTLSEPALSPARPMPYAFNYFDIRLTPRSL